MGALSRAASAAFGARAAHFDSQEALVAALQAAMRETDAGKLRLLVKGSRSSAMDKVVAALRGAQGGGGHAA